MNKKETARLAAHEYRKTYPEYLNNYFATETGFKNKTKSRWKNELKVKFTEKCSFDLVFETYMASSHCYCCSMPFTEKRRKNLDHCHITGLPRAILCTGCNIMKVWGLP